MYRGRCVCARTVHQLNAHYCTIMDHAVCT